MKNPLDEARIAALALWFIAPLRSILVRIFGTRTADGIGEFWVFGIKELAACVFAGSFLALLLISNYVHIPGLARYDFLFLGALAIQAVLIATRVESAREVAVLSLFHALGMALELFKTSPQVGSWSYPEEAMFRIATVPLYSGFMYAAVASYLMQAWRLLDVRIEKFPPLPVALALCAAIYGNFFTNHYIMDVRWYLAALIVLVFWRSKVRFRALSVHRTMPLILAFVLIGFFIWVAENIATFFGGWVYPDQHEAWAIVGPAKISSWALLVIISFVIVAALKQVFPKREKQSLQ